MTRSLGFLLFALAVPYSVLAAGLHPEVASYALDVRFEPSAARMQGVAHLRFRSEEFPLTTARFYLHGELHVDSLVVGGRRMEFTEQAVPYTYDYSLVASEVTVDLSGLQPAETLSVAYRGYFHPSRARAISDYMRIDRTGVYLRAYAYSLWFPIFMPAGRDDYPVDFTSVTLSTPADYRSVFTGERVGESVVEGRRMSTWMARGTSLFDAQCSARRWQVLDGGEIQVYHLPEPEAQARGASILRFAREAMTFFAGHYGAGTNSAPTFIMQMPEYGDISSGNVSGISEGSWLAFDGDWVSKHLLAHEMVHAFTATRISLDDNMWCFVVEGFPSYFHLPFLSATLGSAWYEGRIETLEQQYLRKRQTGLSGRGRHLPPEKPIDAIPASELGLYKDTFVLNDRVILFFDFLRRRMGDDDFLSMCRVLFEQPRLSTNVVREIIETHYPGAVGDIEAWLSTSEFPEWMRLEQ